jgi:molecular chaperone GrpE
LAKQEKKEETLETVEEVIEENDSPVDETQAKIEKLENDVSEWEDKYKRLYAEFDNYQKRTQKEKDARYADAVIDTVGAFLEIADNLDRAVAIEVNSEESQKVLDGVALVKKQMTDTLSKLNVTEIKALGEEFDPNIHNAVMHVEDESVTDNTVVEEFLKGYIYKNERVVRHSMVKVAN